MTNFDKALKLCRGSYQRGLVERRERLGGGALRGKAKMYSLRYINSGINLLYRLEQAGIPFWIEYGPRGGYHNAILHIMEDGE